MSSKIDERIVGMKFNNDQFQKGVADTNKALEKLKLGLNLNDAAKGLNSLDAAAKNFSLSNLASGAQTIIEKFGALSIIGITALANIANKAIDVGVTIAKSLTIDPIKAGFAEYELKMGSIQTMLANTERYGTTLGEVTASLDELNKYADKTIYNFGDMTKNIGLFTNAGIRIEDATSMIQGFSNVAAASGTSAQGAAGAAYQLSQALSAGTIRLMDWRSLTNVGMGNKNMQLGIVEIADAMGLLEKNSTSADEVMANFNGSLEKNWLSADVMSNYLKIMAGDMDDAGMAALGLSDAQIASFKKTQATAEDAATKVRTWTQLLGTLQEGVGSGWAQTFDLLIGDFDQATELWTAVSEELGTMIGRQADARNKLLQTFVDIGGRDAIIEGLASIWQAFQMYLMPIQSAFREIFPPISAGKLGLWAKQFRDFAESLKPTADTMKLLKRTFMGVFAVFDIGWMILKNVIGIFGRLFGAATEGAGGILEITANIGDFLVTIRDAIKNGEGLEKFFKGLGDALQWPIDKLRELGKWTVSLFNTDGLVKAWEGVVKVFQWLGDTLEPVGKWISEAFTNIKDAVTGFFETMDFNVLVGLLNVGALAGIGIGIKKAFDFLKGRGIMGLIFGDSKEKGPGLIDTIKNVFGAVTDTFKTMQTTLKSASLIGIAIAIALISASILMLSTVDTDTMFITLGAMTIMFGQLSAMLLAIDKLTKKVNTGKVIGVAIALGILAGAMLVMSTAILILSTMDWVELARGLSGMAVGMAILVGAALLLDKVKYKMMGAAGAILVMSFAMVILAAALKIMSTMSWDDIGRSMTVLVGAMAVMVGAGYLAKKGAKNIGAMIAMGIAIAILAGALKIFSTMSWDDIGRSMTVFAGAMAVMVGAMMLLDLMKNVPVGAGSMILMAFAITILAGAMKIFSKMSWEEIGKSLVMLAGSLAILAGAMALMGIPLVALGGLALLVVSAGLMMLAPALVLLGTMSWDAIGRGLTMLAASLGILAIGGLLLIPASVGFLLFGAALLMIGGAVLMVGQGLLLFSIGFSALVAAATLGAPAIVNAMIEIAKGIPIMLAAFAQGIIDFALVIAGGATEFTMAMVALITALMDAIAETGPLVINTIWDLIVLLVAKIVEGVPLFVDSGMKIIIGILEGIDKNLPKLLDAAGDVISKFITGLGDQALKIAKAGGDTVIKFINGITDYIKNNANRFVTAGSKLFRAVVDGVSLAIERGGSDIRYAGQRIGDALLQGAMNALGINSPSKEFRDNIMGSVFEGIEKGNDKNIYRAGIAGTEIGQTIVSTTAKALDKISEAVATDIDFNPTIKPILDLSAIKQGNNLIGGLLTPPSLKVDDSYAYASSIATAQRTSEEAVVYDEDGPNFAPTYTFIQNNTSPKALSPAELYRQGSNLLSVVKKGQPTNA